MTLTLHNPAAASGIGPVEGLEAVTEAGAALLRQLLEVAAENPQISTAGLLERFRHDPDGRQLGSLAAAQPLDDEDAARNVLRDCLERIVAASRRERLSALLARGSSLSEEEKAEARELLRASRRQATRPEA